MLKKSASILLYNTIAILLLFTVSCSQTKNTALYRGWHNMNARFNGSFYSKEYLNETIEKVEKEHRDDFTKLIPLFIYPDNERAKIHAEAFDNTIKKSSVVIQRHAIMEKRSKEEIPNASRWIDENYILIGQAHLYKRDLFSALEAFEYVATIYPQPKTKYTGMIWKTRANNEIGSYSLSEITLDVMRTAKDFPKDTWFQRAYALVSADYYIKTNDYEQAISKLTKAITLTRNKKNKARSTFLLAQLYEKQGDAKKASMYYSMVPGLHPNYEMLFSAKISSARLYDVTAGNPENVKKQLNKMLKDDKNIEFQDQIYYALAEIANKEKDMPLALSYLDKSIKANTTNATQKALSYLKRADIYFEKTDYKNAQVNYDSTITFLPKDYPDYQLIETKANSLTKLVANLNTITLEDSVQTLARMTEAQRNLAIDKMIAKVEADEKRAIEEEKIKLQNAQFLNQNTSTSSNVPQTGLWYFYNPATLSFGASEFRKKWGAVKLEDNWRRSEKEQAFASNADENGQPEDSASLQANNTLATVQTVKNSKDRNAYIANIPLTPEALEKSTNRIIDAYNNTGLIYKEQLLNNDKSVNAFEELLKRYPENKYKLSNYYQLYRTYLGMNNQTKSDYYKNILLRDYPETEYSKIIKNPDYAKDVMANRSVVEKFYTETYQFYAEGKYNQVLANCLKADTMYAKSTLMPQFAYVKALAIGRTQHINAFEAALTQVLIKYPKSAVSDKAQEMLDLIKAQKNPAAAGNADTLSAGSALKTGETQFVFNEEGIYQWILVMETDKSNFVRLKQQTEQLKQKLEETNSKFLNKRGEALSVYNTLLDSKHQVITVKSFNGKQKAMDYYNYIKSDEDVFVGLSPGSYQMFIISAENYEVFYKDKNIPEYQAFFMQNFQ